MSSSCFMSFVSKYEFNDKEHCKYVFYIKKIRNKMSKMKFAYILTLAALQVFEFVTCMSQKINIKIPLIIVKS